MNGSGRPVICYGYEWLESLSFCLSPSCDGRQVSLCFT